MFEASPAVDAESRSVIESNITYSKLNRIEQYNLREALNNLNSSEGPMREHGLITFMQLDLHSVDQFEVLHAVAAHPSTSLVKRLLGELRIGVHVPDDGTRHYNLGQAHTLQLLLRLSGRPERDVASRALLIVEELPEKALCNDHRLRIATEATRHSDSYVRSYALQLVARFRPDEICLDVPMSPDVNPEI